jgi:hypothetical protein
MSDPKKISPKHYQLSNGFQVIDLTSQLGFCEGNVVKYVARAGNKDGESRLDDLLKARYYLDLLVDQAIIEENKVGDINDPAGIRHWGKH